MTHHVPLSGSAPAETPDTDGSAREKDESAIATSMRSSAVSTRAFTAASSQSTSRVPYRTATSVFSTRSSTTCASSSICLGSPNCTPSIAATMRSRAVCTPATSLFFMARLCAASAAVRCSGSSSSCRMTESTASAIMSFIGSASHWSKACSAPYFLVSGRFKIVSCPPLTLSPGGSGLLSRASSFLTTVSSAGSSFFTAPFLPFAGDVAAFFLPRVAFVGDAGASSAASPGVISSNFFGSGSASGAASGSHEDTV
mmetsp:Transcript_1604/g.7130  ORF Transcript_1604/g.7130 Transcript_1604/m.7130 type:complete len:256 (+) Transcript_1604:434-1201(+)